MNAWNGQYFMQKIISISHDRSHKKWFFWWSTIVQPATHSMQTQTDIGPMNTDLMTLRIALGVTHFRYINIFIFVFHVCFVRYCLVEWYISLLFFFIATKMKASLTAEFRKWKKKKKQSDKECEMVTKDMVFGVTTIYASFLNTHERHEQNKLFVRCEVNALRGTKTKTTKIVSVKLHFNLLFSLRRMHTKSFISIYTLWRFSSVALETKIKTKRLNFFKSSFFFFVSFFLSFFFVCFFLSICLHFFVNRNYWTFFFFFFFYFFN